MQDICPKMSITTLLQARELGIRKSPRQQKIFADTGTDIQGYLKDLIDLHGKKRKLNDEEEYESPAKRFAAD